MIVNDASCLIDLRKGQLLHAMLALPHRFVVPYPVRTSELLDFTPQEWRVLEDGGLITFDLPPDAVGQALQIKAERARLSAHDCFCLVTAILHEDSVLLTGDRLLRTVASDMDVEVHGVLWLLDLLHTAGNSPPGLLVTALETWRDDPAVFLPTEEIEARLKTIRRSMR
ncbi:MAG: type II toxin-antitoxin system VapC family toxin [Pseudorhodoplanes sp.]